METQNLDYRGNKKAQPENEPGTLDTVGNWSKLCIVCEYTLLTITVITWLINELNIWIEYIKIQIERVRNIRIG